MTALESVGDSAGVGEASTGGGVPGDKAEPATEGDVPPGLGLGFKQGKGILEQMGEAEGRGWEKGPVGVEPGKPRRRCEDEGGSQEPLLQAWPERAAESEWEQPARLWGV